MSGGPPALPASFPRPLLTLPPAPAFIGWRATGSIPRASALALVFFALNPNLLYLQTTAMTEPLFLCEVIWIVVWMVEWRAALDREIAGASYDLRSDPSARPRSHLRLVRFARLPLRIFEASGPRRGAWLGNPLAAPAPRKNIPINETQSLQVCIAIALIAAIFTRYDGWIIALLAWSGVGFTLLRHAAAGERGRLSSPAFWLATLAIVAAPLLWFLYNSVSFGDWLYFARGPFSAKAIELRTAAIAPGWPPHPGWHNPWAALLYFVKVSELDSVAAPGWSSLWGNIVVGVAALGTVTAIFTEQDHARRRARAWTLLLWLPVPFYTWSVAYGSVPIFFPAWWPYTWYNTRYGLELLPALALGLGFAVQLAADVLRTHTVSAPCSAWLSSVAFLLLWLSPASMSSCSSAPIPLFMSRARRIPTRACPTTKPFRLLCSRCSRSSARHDSYEHIHLS